MAYNIKSKDKKNRSNFKIPERVSNEKIPMWMIERENIRAGYYWFSPDTKRFFKSVIPKEATRKGNFAYFITRETNPSGDSAYTIRKANLKTGDVDTEGEFFKYSTRAEAQKELNKTLMKK